MSELADAVRAVRREPAVRGRPFKRQLIEDERAVLRGFSHVDARPDVPGHWHTSCAVASRLATRFSEDRPRLRRTLGRLWQKGLVEPDADDVRRGLKRYWRLTPAGVAARAGMTGEGADV